MRKLFTLIASVMALAASAQSFNADMVESISEEPIASTQLDVVAPAMPKESIHKAATAATVDALVGKYVTTQYTYSSTYAYNYSTQLSIAQDESDANTLSITGLPGQSSTYPVKGTIDANGKLSIEPGQQINTSTTYGKVTLKAYITQEGTTTLAVSDDPITFTYYSSGNLYLDQYALVRMIPEYKTGTSHLTPIYASACFFKPNATYTESTASSKTTLATPTDYTYNVYVRQNDTKDTIRVYGFSGLASINIKLATDGSADIDYTQDMYYYSSKYDYCHSHPINVDYETPNVTFYPTKNVTGTIEGGKLTFVPWAFYMESTSTAGSYTSMNGYKLSSSITLNDGKEFVLPDEATAISAVETSAARPAVRKMIQNGQLVIVKGDKTYNVAGATLK